MAIKIHTPSQNRRKTELCTNVHLITKKGHWHQLLHTVHRVCLLLGSFGAAVLNITCSRLHNLKCWFSKLAVERCSVRQKRHSCQYTVLCVCVRKCTCLYVCNRGATRVNMPSPHLCFVWGYFPATNLTFWCLSTLSVHHPRDPPGCY